jgi:hypothetical protein
MWILILLLCSVHTCSVSACDEATADATGLGKVGTLEPRSALTLTAAREKADPSSSVAALVHVGRTFSLAICHARVPRLYTSAVPLKCAGGCCARVQWPLHWITCKGVQPKWGATEGKGNACDGNLPSSSSN